ncbi:MAG TPA: glycosyltransferase [Thermoanaerobaculia bacterium]|nr:glycosyltransferase [Thermoanaerobaculia bacterium]
MRVFGIMMVRNEADILRINLLHHRAIGIDRFLILDNGSTDGTPDILRDLEEYVAWSSDPGAYRQSELTTELAREAVRQGADWIIPIDADEFWYAPAGNLRSVLENSGAGAIRVQVQNFIQHRDQLRSSPEALLGMTRRSIVPIGPLERVRPLVEARRFAYVEMMYQPKWISRAFPSIEIAMGNHHVSGIEGPLEDSDDVVCLHAVLRSKEALEAKVEQGARVAALGLDPSQGWHVQRWRRLAAQGELDREWSANSHAGELLDVHGVPHRVAFDPRLRDLVRPFVNTAVDRAAGSAEDEAETPASDIAAMKRTLQQQLAAFGRADADAASLLRSEVAQRDEKIRMLQAELFEKVAERDGRILGLQEEMVAKVGERDEALEALQREMFTKVAEAEGQIEALQRTMFDKVAEAEAEIHGLREEMFRKAAKSETVIRALQEELFTKVGERDEMIRSVQQEMATKLGERDTWIETLLQKHHAELGERDRMIERLRTGTAQVAETATETAGAGSGLQHTSAPGVQTTGAGNRLGNRFDVVCFPIIDWDFRFQRPQQLMSRFAAAGHRVFYISNRFRQHGAPFELRRLRDGVDEVSLRGPGRDVYADTLKRAEATELFESLDALRRELSLGATVSIVQLPFWRPVAERARAEFSWPLVYDCMDHHAGFSTSTTRTDLEDRTLIARADLVIVSSMFLEDAARSITSNLKLVRNACDYEHFAKIGAKRRGKRPVIGYYGAIADWFDADLVADLAEQHPKWDFLLVGSTALADVSRLSALKNVTLTGEKPYDEIPDWLARFDVALIPFKRLPLTEATNPVKVYEMFAGGKPVVSVPIPEVLPLAPLVGLASNSEEFAREIERALNEDDEALREERRRFAKANTWEIRFAELAPAVERIFPRASIAIVTYDNLEMNRRCLESLYETMDWPNFEVFVVDNASSDGTPELLRELSATLPNMTLILNEKNLGFAAANNQALRLVTGEILVLLNNDTVLCRGWLSALIRHLRADPSIGILGPSTNAIGNEAMIEAGYSEIEEMPAWARDYVREHDGELFDISMLAMFCVAMRRDVLENVGELDERFGTGMFEDDDYAYRIREAGLRVVCTRDAFVHHWMKAAFGKMPSDEYRRLFETNRALFEAKWKRSWIPHRSA